MSPLVVVIKIMVTQVIICWITGFVGLIISDLAHYCLTGEIDTLLFLARKQNTTDQWGGDRSPNASSLCHCRVRSTVQTCTAVASGPG